MLEIRFCWKVKFSEAHVKYFHTTNTFSGDYFLLLKTGSLDNARVFVGLAVMDL